MSTTSSSENSLPRPRKIAIIGGGKIGMELWKELTERATADEVVVWNRSDKYENDVIRGTMSAVNQANLINNDHKFTSHFRFSTDLETTLQGADIVVVTAGVPRKQGMKRSDLVTSNSTIIDPVAEAASRSAPDANYIIATNPVDTMTQRFQEKSGIPHNRIAGLSGELDRARMMESICFQMGVPPESISNAHVIGEHGETMVPLLSGVMIKQGGSDRKLTELLEGQPEKLAEIREATVKGGGRLIEKLGTSDHIAPAAALRKMIENLCKVKWNGHESSGQIDCSAYDPKEGVYIGRPVEFQTDGTYKTLPLPELSHSEKAAWDNSVKVCRTAVEALPDRKADRPLG